MGFNSGFKGLKDVISTVMFDAALNMAQELTVSK